MRKLGDCIPNPGDFENADTLLWKVFSLIAMKIKHFCYIIHFSDHNTPANHQNSKAVTESINLGLNVETRNVHSSDYFIGMSGVVF